MAQDFFPCPSVEILREAFLGKKLQDVPAPAAILDRLVVERNCKQMCSAVQDLNIMFRPHVKTHKTVEVTRMQVGALDASIRLVFSTISEAEHLCDYLAHCKEEGRHVNILYGVPLPPSQIHRLSRLGERLGHGSISVMIDHPSQLECLHMFKDKTGFAVGIFIKIDTGYQRAGINAESMEFRHLILQIAKLEMIGSVSLQGLYSHAGHSYGGDSRSVAMALLIEEIEKLEYAAKLARSIIGHEEPPRQFVLSVGATPTTTSTQNLINNFDTEDSAFHELKTKLKACIDHADLIDSVELHAGVYPILDMQQIATRASPSAIAAASSVISTSDIALTILAEVASLYLNRDSPEALIAAGSLALGREPCKSYSGWGIVSDWGFHASSALDGRSGWQVGRISQEHGILTPDGGPGGTVADLRVGQKVRIWPNHACVAGAGFGWYLVVDSGMPDGRKDEVVDVWVRWRGW